jgi:membrane associated rhomboid family serine protease
MKWIFSFFGVPLLEIPSRTLLVMGLWGAVQAAMAFIPWSELPKMIPYLAKFSGTIFTVHPTAGTAWDAHLGAVGVAFILFAWFTGWESLKKKKKKKKK